MRALAAAQALIICVIMCVACATPLTNAPPQSSPARVADASTEGTVLTRYGMVRGVLTDNHVAYHNIPFAAPPTGADRWKPPTPPVPWSDVRDATTPGPSCPQPERATGGGGRPVSQDEDCLNLNVWVPKAARNLPVMVWIHGGGHRAGSGSFPIYDGAGLAADGVVVVTINFRLGLLGYFAHPALTAEAPADEPLGNYGLMDQLAALKWVRDNIRAFGGDPDNVTVIGQSAGATSVLYLLSADDARGLFHKAIVQSGGGGQSAGDLARQEQGGLAVAARAGLPPDTTAAALRALAVNDILTAQGPLQGVGFGPFVDGRLVRSSPSEVFAAGAAHDIPMLIGANSHDASVLEQLGVGPDAVGALAGKAIDELRAAYSADTLGDAAFSRQVLGDAAFVGPARRIAAAAASGQPTFLYHFAYVAQGRRGQAAGANHGSEIPYIFKTWSAVPGASDVLTQADRSFGDGISGCWTTFAKTGAPDCFGLEWPRYEASTDPTVVFDTQTTLVPGFRKPQLDMLDRLSAPGNPR
jgi:para-nitrobenzyl esterase